MEFSFRIIWGVMEILEGVIRRGRNTLLDLHNSSYDTKANSIIVLLFIQNSS